MMPEQNEKSTTFPAYPVQALQSVQPADNVNNPGQPQPMTFTAQLPMAVTDPDACQQCGGKNHILKVPPHIMCMIIYSSIHIVGLFLLFCLPKLKQKRCVSCNYAEHKQYGWFYGIFASLMICFIIFWSIALLVLPIIIITQAMNTQSTTTVGTTATN